MKLFFYDTKHQQVIGNTDLGNLIETEVKLVNSVLEFLQDNLMKFVGAVILIINTVGILGNIKILLMKKPVFIAGI